MYIYNCMKQLFVGNYRIGVGDWNFICVVVCCCWFDVYCFCLFQFFFIFIEDDIGECCYNDDDRDGYYKDDVKYLVLLIRYSYRYKQLNMIQQWLFDGF